MKKLLFLIPFLIYQLGLSQVSYVSTDFADVGYSQIVSNSINDADYNFVQTGTNFNWNYSGLMPINQETISFVNPENTGYKQTWCTFNFYFLPAICNSQFSSNFNIATQLLGSIDLGEEGSFGNVYAHMRKTTANIQNRMVGIEIPLEGQTQKLVINYSSPDTLYEFPFTFNSTNTSVSQAAINLAPLFPLSITLAQERINTVEGWGSLTTPFGTFNNVLKMKTVLNALTTINNDGEIEEIPSITHEYKWFDKAYGIPVLEVSGQVVEGVWTADTVRYVDNQLSTNIQQLNDITLYPNPTSGKLFTNLRPEQLKSVEVYNLFGQIVAIDLNISHLNAGFYLVTIESDFGKITKKILKQ